MRTRRLGNSDLELTTVGIGTFAIGGSGWKASWGPQDDSDSIAAIQAALDQGVNWIDTAPVYGIGHAEEVVGKALAGLSETPIIATKCGRFAKGDELYSILKTDSIKQECEQSLQRLGVDVIDLLQIHWPFPDEDIEEGWRAIAELVEEGKVRYGGVSNFSVEQMQRCRQIMPITSLQPPYSLVKRDIEDEILPFCGANNIGTIVYSPMQKGLLTGKITPERMANLAPDDHRRRDPMFNEPKLSVNLKLVTGLTEIAEAAGRTPAQLALAWTLVRPEVTAAIAGLRKPEQTAEAIAAGDWEMTAEEVAQVEELLQTHAAEMAAL